MGVAVRPFCVALVLLSSLLAACVTAFAGPISFVGIAVPHLVKQALGSAKPLHVLPGCALGGAAFCLLCDLIARSLFAPHRAFHQLRHSGIWCAGSHLAVGAPPKRGGPGMSEAFYCQTQDLAIGYGKTPLLQNIGIGVQRGQILALIGPNGAGKSTLLKTLAGQLAAQSGAVLLQGQNLTTYTPNARARKWP